MENKKSYLLVILSIAISFLFSVSANADSNESFNTCEAKTEDARCSLYDSTIQFVSDKYHFSVDETIYVSYVLFTDGFADEISDIEYIPNGFTDVEIDVETSENKKINIKLDCLDSVSKCSLVTTVYLSNTEIYELYLYAVKNQYGVFISPASIEHANQRYENYAINSGIIQVKPTCTLEEWIDLKSNDIDVSSLHLEKISSNYSTYAATDYEIEGTVSWKDHNNIEHKLSGVKIDLYAKKELIDIFLGTTKSNNDGTYSIPKSALSNLVFEDDCLDLYIKVYADDGNVSVHDGTDVLKHIYNDVSEVKSVTINEWNSSNTFIDFAAKMESSKGQAFQIYQAAIISRDYAQVMMGEQPENVFIYYPMNDSDGCHYLDSVNQIHITGIDVNGTMEPCPYDSWDVIMHEYGHHIEFIVDIIGITGYAHDFGENLADRTAYDKEIGIKVAWKEAWPTAFGMLAQMYYSYYTNDVNGANDTFYDAYNFRGAYSLENVDILDRTGEACETAIIALLWDLFDNTPSGDDYNDTLSFGHEKWWAITTKSRTYTFSDFLKNFYKEYPEYIGSMGEALSFYHMTTTNPVLDSYTTPSQTTPPTFTWEFQDSSLYYPNDVFELVIYDKAGKEILRSSSYTRDSTGKFTDTLTTSEWQKVLYSYGTTYKVAVSASQSGNPVSGLTTTHPVGPQTGEYISGWITL